MKNKEAPDSAYSLSLFWSSRQPVFISMLKELSCTPTPRHAYLASLLEVIGIETYLPARKGRGRIPRTRVALVRAFLAKAQTGGRDMKSFRNTLLSDDALRAVCGFWRDVPSESTFSRAFAFFAQCGLGDIVLADLAQKTFSDSVVMHVSRDSTAISARERPYVKPKKEPKPKERPGRKKGVPPKPKEPTRQELQLQEKDLSASLAELPKLCDIGTKRNAKGHDEHWCGYKFHVDVTDEGFPISAITTSASVHDCQVAIPLMRQSASRVMAICYQVMDAGYVGQPILQAARELGQVPIVAPKGTCTTPVVPMDRASQIRFRIRTVAERFFSDVKDNRAGNHIRVKGHAKVHLHLMFGLLAVFGMKLLAI